MSKLYFTRHGETVWNVENKICGTTDSPLTEKGHLQAIALGEKIAEEIRIDKVKIDRILCSPLSRAHDTAKHIAEITGIRLEVEPLLTEQCFGTYEGTPRDGKEFWLAKQSCAVALGGGETMLHVAYRIYTLLDRLKEDRKNNYLLVAHNGISRHVASYFGDLSNEEFSSYGIGNAELLEFEF